MSKGLYSPREYNDALRKLKKLLLADKAWPLGKEERALIEIGFSYGADFVNSKAAQRPRTMGGN